MSDNASKRDPMQRLRGMLGLAKKAGRVISGTELVCDAVRKGKVAHVYVARDTSQNTQKRLINCCSYYEVGHTVINISGNELASAIGKSAYAAAVAVNDIGFTAQLNKIIDENIECCKAGTTSAGGAADDTKSEIQN